MLFFLYLSVHLLLIMIILFQ